VSTDFKTEGGTLFVGRYNTAEEANISAAVGAGTGLVNFDNDLSADGSTYRYAFVDHIFSFGYTTPPTGSDVTFTTEGTSGTRINCWEDDHQDPVLVTTENVPDLVETDGLWTEFLYTPVRSYPTILAGADEEDFGLPVIHFFASGIPNGEYEVLANLYTSSAGRDMRYYYGYAPGDPKAYFVDTVGGAGGSDQHAEYSLGTVTITDGTFDIYAQDADLTGTGTYPFFGWAWIRLVEAGAPPSEMHYITELHEAGEFIGTGSMTMAGITLPEGVASLAVTGSEPFLAVTSSGQGNAVQWGTTDWMSHSVKGPVYGFDDLVWRSMVWAARKPFVMQGMPPFFTMRVDDESGPFDWIHIANEFGFKPWAGLFLHNIDEAEAADLYSLVDAGLATTAIHAFNGGFFYFNHSGSDWPDEVIAAHYEEGTQWHLDHDIPISKFVLPHYYEIGTNAFQGLSDWGVEFVGTMMDPGSGYDSGVPWIANGPYRLFETGSTRYAGPLYYADFLTVPGHPEFDGQFFNCVTEIRDDAGYEWYPSNDIAGSVGRGTRQSKRSLDSMVLTTLFTHDQSISGITLENWRAILEGITTNIAPYNPIYVTLDHACQYIRATHTSDIAGSSYDPVLRQLTTTLTGGTDMPTMFYLFTEQDSTILSQMIDVPTFSGSTDVIYQLAGPLDHIVVSPDTAVVAEGGEQQFTAQGYDIDDNPIPNLPFDWSVVSGGGTIDGDGLFTAGVSPGIFTNTVVASYDGIEGYATVEVITPTLDHFTIEPISSPKYVDIPFSVTIAARDISGNLLVGYTGIAFLSDTTGTVAPLLTDNFAGGLWYGDVTIGLLSDAVTITATDGLATGSSNLFQVQEIPGYYDVSSESYVQMAGVPFQVTVTANALQLNCWDDDIQNPDLYTFYDADQFVPDDDQWDEFKYHLRDYPGVFASQTENPPVMEFSGVVPNGTYQVIANLYWSNDYRYYYGFEPGAPRAFSVDVTNGPAGDFAEFDLGTVTVTDNVFALYTDHADVLYDRGSFPYYGWAWIRLVPTQAEAQINCWEDDHQNPVLATTDVVGDLVATDGLWTEFLYLPSRDYPTILADADEEDYGLPVMEFYTSGLSNGEYEVIANLYTSGAGRDMRYYYGFTPGDPKALSVDTVGGAGGPDQHEEYSLGTVTITDGTFSIYVQDADMLGSGYTFFGWAWIRLVPAQAEPRIDCWEDDQQSPVLVTTESVGDLVATDGLWTEFLYLPIRDYPTILADADEEDYGLPVMEFYTSDIPDGAYEIIANLYTSSAGRDMRYYYGFTPGDPKANFVDTVGGAGGSDQHEEYSLGYVNVTDGTFSIYVQDADMLGSGYPFFGWAWIRLIPADPNPRINCWEDDHQNPVLATTDVVADLVATDGLWTEFLYLPIRDYPTILADADEENYGLPVMQFYSSGISNGEYEIFANLYTSSAGRDMRYYYGFTPGDPKAYSVDTVGGAGGSDQHEEYSLGTVIITDGTFSIYVQDADMLGSGYPFFGWAWIRLESGAGDQTMISMSSSSPTLIFDGNGNGIFGEADDHVKGLVDGAMNIMAMDHAAGTDVLITAIDDFGFSGENTYTIEALPVELEIGLISPSGYELDVLELPPDYTPSYIDRGYWFTSAPAHYVGLPFIRTANNDRNLTDEDFLAFTVNKPVFLYVLYSASAASPPDWLTGGFVQTGEQVTRLYHTWNVWEAEAGPGEINLGANLASGADTGGASVAMYVVVIEGKEGPTAPLAGFSGAPTSGYAPLEVAFTDLSTGDITGRLWTFGDGEASADGNPVHTYDLPGVYTVSLEVTGPAGTDTHTEVDYITVTPVPDPPVAGFSGTPTSGQSPLEVTFADLSTGEVTAWSWTFGDGETSTDQNPVHTYDLPGVYTVSLEATGPGGADTHTEIDYITVTPGPPSAAFSGTPVNGLAPLEVSLTDLSAGEVTSWSWTFGDGGTSTDQNPIYTYNDPGVYTVSLEVTGPGGTDTHIEVDYVTVTETSAELEINLISPLSYELGILELPPDYTPCYIDRGHWFIDAPEHYVGLPFIRTANNNRKLTDDAFLTFTVNKPVFLYVLYSASAASPPDWLTGSFMETGEQITRLWHTWNVWEAEAGPGEITMGANLATGADTGGASVGMYVVVIEEKLGPTPPLAGFSGTPTSGYAPLGVSFTDLSTGDITSRLWTFGDGETSTAQNPVHTYDLPGVYTVSLEVTGPAGTDTHTEVDYITVSAVPDPPVSGFSGTPISGQSPLEATFTNLSTGEVTTWLWTFGDGETSTVQNPVHTYDLPGVYTVSLEATGPGGADTHTEIDYITVTPGPPSAAFSGAPVNGLAPLEISFTDLSAGEVTGWSWTFGDGGTSTDQNPIYTYDLPGVYTVSLEVTGPGGTDTHTEVDYITVTEPSAELEINLVSPLSYELGVLELPPDLTHPYIDRGHWFIDAPEHYVGLPFIRTANNDRKLTAEDFLTFTVNKPVFLYVLYSASAASPPDWLTGSFTETGEQITRLWHTWNVWEAEAGPGEITLGANLAAGADTGGASVGMYVVVIEEQ